MPVIHVTENLPNMNSLPIIEMFSSVQGEGILVGRRQIFVRLAGCNLNCNYCDTPFAQTASCNIEQSLGSGQFSQRQNPLSLSTVVALVQSWSEQLACAHHSISLTGGEPLLHATELRNWLPELSRLLPIQLETNGTLSAELAKVLPWLTWIVMDFKLESQTGVKTPWQQHRQFLQLAAQHECCIKLVVGVNTPDAELHQAAALVAELVVDGATAVPVILQPRTINNKCSVPAKKLLFWQALMSGYNIDVRVIPQTHCYLAMQ